MSVYRLCGDQKSERDCAMRSYRHLMAVASAVVALVVAGCAPPNEGASVPKAVSPVVGEQGPPALLEIPHPEMYGGVQFSPDGKMLAALLRRETDKKRLFCARIYRVSDGALLRELPGGSLSCAWNWDGSLLAIARDNWPDIEIWDVPTWTFKRRLTLFDASRAKVSPYLSQIGEKPRPKSEEPYGLSCGSLCFDRHGNLFVVEGSRLSEEVPTAFPYTIPRGAVFWNAADGWTEINDVDVDLGLSVASLGETTRLAYWDGPYHTVEIWRIENSRSGAGKLRREYGIGEAVLSPSVCLSGDGKYLFASDDKTVCLFELFDDHAKLIHSQEHHGGFLAVRAFSRDGRFAAYRSEGRVTVVRIPSFQTALQIDASASFDLSPDGRLLATEEFRRFATRLYRVPDEGKKDQEGR
jgi:WD40 repeat protein